MQTIGVYLIFAAVAVRSAVVVWDRPEFPVLLALLAAYGFLLFGETWTRRGSHLRLPHPIAVQIAYLFLQSSLVIRALVLSSYEDFLAMLFVPLSLQAVSFFGRRAGYMSIAAFSLAMTATLLFSKVGPLFGLVMGILYSGVCFLFGGYAYQVQKAEAAHDRNERMLRELQTAHRQLQIHASDAVTLAIEHERNRLARELHDSVTQTVFSMNLSVQSVQLLLNKEPSRVAGQLVRLEQLAAGALGEIQALISHLKPASSTEERLPIALRRLAAEQEARYGIRVALEFRGDCVLPEAVATNLYSIAQEALTNVARHSGGCDALVRLHVENDVSCLEIEDHGRGFEPDAMLDRRGHLGLAGMLERAGEIGWQFSVASRPGHGTCVRVRSNPPGGHG
jgi:signal transduction histidine kinase